jgi:propanol-preferring alcohol dehydrogenase
MLLEKPAPVEDQPLAPVDLPAPEPGPGEVRIRVKACGVCHTDLHEVEGDLPLPKLPLVPGHEVIGVVDKLGDGAEGPVVGTRVGVPWLYSTCAATPTPTLSHQGRGNVGLCRFCQTGRENLCENIRFTGYSVHGGYAEYIVVPAGFCYPVPDRFADAEAAPLMCAGVIGFRALRIAGVGRLDIGTWSLGISEAPRLGLYGFGASAHISLQVAKHWSWQTAVFTRTPSHQKLARDLGADWVGTIADPCPWPLDSGIIFAPAGELVPVALGHLAPGGTLAHAGIHSSPIPQFEYDLIYHERTLRSVANSTRDDVRRLLALADEIPLRTTVETLPLESANEALLRVKLSRARAAAVLTVA